MYRKRTIRRHYKLEKTKEQLALERASAPIVVDKFGKRVGVGSRLDHDYSNHVCYIRYKDGEYQLGGLNVKYYCEKIGENKYQLTHFTKVPKQKNKPRRIIDYDALNESLHNMEPELRGLE